MNFSKLTIIFVVVSLWAGVQTSSASIIDFSGLTSSSDLTTLLYDTTVIDSTDNLDGPILGEGFLALVNPDASRVATIYFDAPQVVFGIDLHGHGYAHQSYLSEWDSEDLTIRAYSPVGSLLWENIFDLRNYNDLAMTNWLHVDMGGVSNVDYLTFEASKYSHPSFDNLNVEAVPIPGAVWLLGSGLFGMIALRRKSNK